MNGYVPKVGDRVRATLGQAVVVGEVAVEELGITTSTGCLLIAPDGLRSASAFIRCWAADGWQFEQVVSVPTKFGAVIRRADGRRFVLAFGDEAGAPDWWNPIIGWATTEIAIGTGFTVLFEGVDE